MLFDAQHEGALKKWIVKRLEDISDADSDVLADYVLALLRHDSPQEEVRKLCIEQLEDFLKEHTATFVDDIFKVIRTSSYDSDAGQSQSLPTKPLSMDAPVTSIEPASGGFVPPAPRSMQNGGQAQSRKRSFNDFDASNSRNGRDGFGTRGGGGDRQFKQPRKGSFRGSKFDNAGSFGARQGPPQLGRGQETSMGNNVPNHAQSPSLGFPGMPPAPPGFPFDPNDPMAAMMAMQAMGFPPLPGLPGFPQVGSPTNFGPNQNNATGSAGPEQRRTGLKGGEKCKDYEEKGFCALGNACPYQHGPDHVVVPEKNDEYDPTNSSMMLDANGSNGKSEHQTQDGGRGGYGRGRGRGRGGSGFTLGRKGRAEFSSAGPNHDRSITTVVVESIPEDKFDEQTVRDFFSSFGTIQDVQMQAYKRLALVKFEDWPSARRAYDSPKVIFDNRFVKVYWYKSDATSTTPAANGNGKASSPSQSQRPESPKVDMEEVRRRQEELQKAHDEKMKKIKATEESKLELEKRKEELMKSQAEEKRKLLERIAAKTGSSGNKSASQASPTPPAGGSEAAGTTDGQGKKTSSQTEALRAQLAALEAEAQSLGIDSSATDDGYAPRGRGRGRPFLRGRGSYGSRGRGGYDPYRGSGYRGRGAPSFGRGGGGGGGGVAYKLDNRTKKVAVSGVEFDEGRDEALRQYLLGVGEFENIEGNPDRKDSQLITFKDRFTAEKFVYGTTDIPSVGKVELSWVNTPLPPVVMPSTSSQAGQTLGGTIIGDATMEDHDQETIPAGDEMHKTEDYDVAEDDDRWMVE